MDELITLVDIDDKVIGYGKKADVHRKGILHRAFSIFIVNKDMMLLQKRNTGKYHSGGLWSNACCSHQRKEEELQEAVHRRLKEEMGFDCSLEEKYTFIYRTEFSEDLFEYELDHVFVGSYDGKAVFDPEEVSEVRWVSFVQLKEELIDHPEQFSSWFIISAPKVMEIQNEDISSDPCL